MSTKKKTTALKKPRKIGVGDYVVVRAYSAGVHYGRLAAISDDATVVDLTEARHIWSWSKGRLTVTDIARVGASSGDKIGGASEASKVVDVCEVHLCTAAAETSLRTAPVS